jgi:predicted RNase H-like nuclease
MCGSSGWWVHTVVPCAKACLFDEALAFIAEVSAGSTYTLIGLDQPTSVPNGSGMRPAERRHVGDQLGRPLRLAREPRHDRYVLRCVANLAVHRQTGCCSGSDRRAGCGSGPLSDWVFPALALASLKSDFCRRLGAPRYNPANARRFDAGDWDQVCATAAACFERWALPGAATWCRSAAALVTPSKADQDQLDAMLCLAVALHWRLAPPDQSILIGDLDSGYIVSPASAAVRARLDAAARKLGVAIDGSTANA